MKLVLVLTVIVYLVKVVLAGVPLLRFEALINQQSLELGLYNSSDKVNILTDANFNESVINQNRSTLVEFYNSYCGHCKRFAPVYKQLADEIYSWREIVPVCAIDCAAEENNGICREYEVMGYPTVRYMGPGFIAKEENYGKNILSQDISEIKHQLATFIADENRTTALAGWPNFQSLSEDEYQMLLGSLPSDNELLIIAFEPENSTTGVQTILHFSRWPSVVIRRVNDLNVASKYKIDSKKYKIATVKRNGDVTPYETANDNVESYVETIKSILNKLHVTEKPFIADTIKRNASALNMNLIARQSDDLINEVLKNKHLIYQADLEMAIRGLLFNEIPRVHTINGERLLALQRLLNVVDRYNPLGENGRKFVKQLHEFVMQFNQELTGQEFEKKLKELEKTNSPVFSSSRFVGCSASVPNLRGFTCSLWQLFHFFTVQAAENDISQDPLEVLQAMHGYVRYFFGCTDCSEHFQSMAKNRKIWSTPNKDEAILWLWAAHNEVNQRLAGDATEDPKFPKMQFPSESSCPECFKDQVSTNSNLESNWNKDAVLNFLKAIHNAAAISRLGVDNESLLHPSLDKLRQKRMISNVFSDVDMRMGMLLYGFCIIMMIAAFKLFVFKGYRKKPYGHDLLGKV